MNPCEPIKMDKAEVLKIVRDIFSAAAEAPKPIGSPTPSPPQIAISPVTALAVDLGEAAKLLGVSRSTVMREIRAGRLRALLLGAIWRVRVAELNRYLLALEREAPQRSRRGRKVRLEP